jgi:hypothetical protein
MIQNFLKIKRKGDGACILVFDGVDNSSVEF